MARIAVTGAGGFIGRRLIERLCRQGDTVRALVRRRSPDAEVEAGRLETVRGALGDDRAIEELLDGVDAVVHLAGLIKAKNRAAFFDVNEDGARHLAGFAADLPKPPKLVLVSSLAAREPGLSAYAASKRAGEEAIAAFGEALPWTILRPPAVYGPGDRETLAFFKGISRGVGAMLGGERARFSLVHVDDLATAIAAVLNRRIADRCVFELHDGAEGGHGWRSMIAAGERAMNRKVLKIRVPQPLLRLIGHANGVLGRLPGYMPMLTAEKVQELTHEDWVADNAAISSATGWRPSIAVERGFPATVEWYQLHKWL